jgi:hypothetical protein
MLVITLQECEGLCQVGARDKNDAHPMMDKAAGNWYGRSAFKRLQPLGCDFAPLQACGHRFTLLWRLRNFAAVWVLEQTTVVSVLLAAKFGWTLISLPIQVLARPNLLSNLG